MGFWNSLKTGFPYSNLHSLNLDWILHEVAELRKAGLTLADIAQSITNLNQKTDGLDQEIESVYAVAASANNLGYRNSEDISSLRGSNAETAKNADNLGGKPPTAYADVNRLDNSNFTIAQAGYNSAHGSIIYLCDRWISTVTSGTKVSNGIQFDNNNDGLIYQRLQGIAGKTLTFAMKTNGTAEQHIAVFTSDLGHPIQHIQGYVNGDGIICGVVSIPADVDVAAFVIYPENNSVIEWAAVYDGTYTADTIPLYVPKNYVTELAACQRYFVRIGGNDYTNIGIGYAQNTTQIACSVNLPQPLRTGITATLIKGGAGNMTAKAGNVFKNISTVSVNQSGVGTLLANLTSENLSQGMLFDVYVPGGSWFDISADL